MAFVPKSKIILCNVPLVSDNKNQIYFANKTAQYNYFLSKKVKEYDDCTYQRADSHFKAPVHIDNIWNCNYVMYQNANFTDKWFFGYITKLEYVNDSCTAVYIKTDVFQTWLFDITLKSSFVIREHVTNDSIGANTLDEGLDTGELKNKRLYDLKVFSEYWYILGSTIRLGSEDPTNEKTFGGTYCRYLFRRKTLCYKRQKCINYYVTVSKFKRL